MRFDKNPYAVYVRANSDGYIMEVNSSAFLTDTAGWMEIDSGYGDKYHHAQGNYFLYPVYTESGACRYKLANGKVKECTDREISEQLHSGGLSSVKTLEERVILLENSTSELKKLLSDLLGKTVQ